eukprot:6375227-Prymnesium_polylepis.1
MYTVIRHTVNAQAEALGARARCAVKNVNQVCAKDFTLDANLSHIGRRAGTLGRCSIILKEQHPILFLTGSLPGLENGCQPV